MQALNNGSKLTITLPDYVDEVAMIGSNSGGIAWIATLKHEYYNAKTLKDYILADSFGGLFLAFENTSVLKRKVQGEHNE